MKLLLWFLVAIIPYGIGEYWSKRWGNEGQTRAAVYCTAAYLVSSLCWLGIMRTSNKLFVMGVVWQAVGALLGFVVGVLWFGETMRWTEILGVILAITALACFAVTPQP